MKHLFTATLFPLATSFLLVACVIPTQPRGGQYQPASNEGGGAPSNAAPAAAPAPAASPAAPAAPSVVSVTLRNSCRQTVKVFYGKKPKFGSGTYSTLSSNSRSSKQFRPGDMVWIVDDSQNGVASATVDARTRTIEVDSSCTGLRAQ